MALNGYIVCGASILGRGRVLLYGIGPMLQHRQQHSICITLLEACFDIQSNGKRGVCFVSHLH